MINTRCLQKAQIWLNTIHKMKTQTTFGYIVWENLNRGLLWLGSPRCWVRSIDYCTLGTAQFCRLYKRWAEHYLLESHIIRNRYGDWSLIVSGWYEQNLAFCEQFWTFMIWDSKKRLAVGIGWRGPYQIHNLSSSNKWSTSKDRLTLPMLLV